MNSSVAKQANAKQANDGIWAGGDELSVLTFDLNKETFAIEATVVQEILDLLPETKVPGGPAFVGSVINFRGKVIPLADIRIAFGMDATRETIDSRIIVIQLDLDGEVTLVGIRTDKVYEVTRMAKIDSEPPPSIGMRWRADYINGLVKRDGEFIIIPNLQAIFSSKRANTPKAAA
jgi:purine-binding chemotaxis protein CheW